ncbi:MAG TPA: TolC family protein [Verrucomicrobiae bacterium]|jgi:outer membrane protein TolC
MYSEVFGRVKRKKIYGSIRPFPVILLAGLLPLVMVGKDLAPPSPDQAWSPPELSQYQEALTNKNLYVNSNAVEAVVESDKIYSLPELIDLAERNNPHTRIAWAQAVQAASAVGLSQSAYYPYLAARAGAGYQRELAVLTSVFPANISEEDATLDVKWLLFDFGGRKARVASAREQLMIANVSFNATHQKIVFAVTKSFYDYNIARQKVAVAESALQAAQTVSDAAHARLDHGLATKPEVLQAEQQTAQATYDLEAARGDLSDAQVALVDSLGILPSTQLQVADVAEKHFAETPDESLDDLIDRALSQRPDLVAKLATLRARQDEVRKARSEYYPKISLEGSAGWQKIDVTAFHDPSFGNSKPGYGIGLAIDLPLFDGFARRNQLKIAEAELSAAESELTDTRDTAVREVWKAYTDLKTALHKQATAEKLLDAAQSAFDASLEAFRNGLGTYVDTANAQHSVTAARSTLVNTRSAIFLSTTALALSVGDLAKPSDTSTHPAP